MRFTTTSVGGYEFCPYCAKAITLVGQVERPVFRVHGPRNKRCPGSGKAPRIVVFP